jgi:hypothetical protein
MNEGCVTVVVGPDEFYFQGAHLFLGSGKIKILDHCFVLEYCTASGRYYSEYCVYFILRQRLQYSFVENLLFCSCTTGRIIFYCYGTRSTPVQYMYPKILKAVKISHFLYEVRVEVLCTVQVMRSTVATSSSNNDDPVITSVRTRTKCHGLSTQSSTQGNLLYTPNHLDLGTSRWNSILQWICISDPRCGGGGSGNGGRGTVCVRSGSTHNTARPTTTPYSTGTASSGEWDTASMPCRSGCHSRQAPRVRRPRLGQSQNTSHRTSNVPIKMLDQECLPHC